MKLLTAEQMRLLDETTMTTVGIPGIVLMENASRGLFDAMETEFFGPMGGKHVVIICGKGNNGGDGFAVARHLLLAKAVPHIFLAASKREISGDAKTNMDICLNLKIPVIEIIKGNKKSAALTKELKSADVVVDALLGTGVKGPLKPEYLNIIQTINKCGRPIVAVDVPSGISVNDGRVYNGAVKADITVTFGAPKIGLFVQPAASLTGTVYVVDIGIPPSLSENVKNEATLVTGDFVSSTLGKRATTSHKGDCGKILIIGGSKGMSGSISLSGSSALKSGAGMVFIAYPESLLSIVGKKLTECISFPMREENGHFATDAADSIVEKMKGMDAIVLGPGMGVSSATETIVSKVISAARVPILVDADGLNCLAKNPSLLKKAKAPVLLTPHPGEMARLTGTSIKAVQESRLSMAKTFAKDFHAVILLKGSDTLVADHSGHTYVNTTGNPGMATAGSGDVLSGIAGALLAEGIEPAKAAACAAFVHGAAGDIAEEKKGVRSLIASDIVSGISKALKSLESE